MSLAQVVVSVVEVVQLAAGDNPLLTCQVGGLHIITDTHFISTYTSYQHCRLYYNQEQQIHQNQHFFHSDISLWNLFFFL